MATMTYIPSRLGEGFFIDVPIPGSGDDGKALTYDHGTGEFVYTAFDPAGTAAAGDAAHVAAGDPHGGYLLASGARAGAAAQRQAFTNGITTGIIRPASDSTTAVRVQTAAGTDLLTADTTNLDVKRSGVPRDDSSLVTRGYAASKLMNLLANGSGLLGNNYNFSAFVFDAVETHGGGGSFKYTGDNATLLSDEYIPIDPERYYRLIAWVKNGNSGGSSHDTNNLHYMGVAAFDADKNLMSPLFFMRHPGAALTTLASALSIGDATMSVVDATGWNNSANHNYSRQFLWWPYVNAQGYSYPNYTYSRNTTYYIGPYLYTNTGAWPAGGISGNTITLSAAWPGPNLPAGTPIMNVTAGSTYKYITMSAANVANAWQRYEGFIGGVDTNGNNNENLFPPGTAYVRLLFLPNYPPTASTNVVRFSDIWFSELSVRNLERFNSSGDLVLQSYSSGARPSAGTAGRAIWNTTTGKVNFDTGSGWTLADGTAA